MVPSTKLSCLIMFHVGPIGGPEDHINAAEIDRHSTETCHKVWLIVTTIDPKAV
jgi:hypothetical protein